MPAKRAKPQDPIVKYAASKVGGVVKLSMLMGKSRATVSSWRRVPAEHVIEVERLTGVSRYLIRPDIYPDRRENAHQQAARSPGLRQYR